MNHGNEGGSAAHGDDVPDSVRDELLATIRDLRVTLDEDGTILGVTDEGSSTLGYQSERLTGRSVRVLFPSEVSPHPVYDVTTVEAFEQAVLDEQTSTVTAPLEAATQEEVPVSLSIVSHPETSRVVCLGQVLDEKFPESQKQTNVLDSIPDPVYLLDEEGRFEEVNEALIEYTGYERADLNGRKAAEILPASEYRLATSKLNELVESRSRSERFETTFITKAGNQIVTEAHVAALTDGDGNLTGSVGVLRDIRERKRREQNLNRLKQVLTRVFRHNVRNELMIARGHAEFLEKNVDEELLDHVDQIFETSDRLLAHSEKARLIEQVIEAEERAELDITQKVEQVVQRIQKRYPDATIRVDLPDLAVVEAHLEIGNAIEELLENAITHAPETEQATVDIWLERRDGTQTLFVEDESGGLSDHEVEVLEQGTENDLEHSSGVGLWLIRWLIEYSGAEMIVHRTEKGSLMGVRFGRQSGAEDSTEELADSPLARTPAHLRESSPERFRGSTVIGRVDAMGTLEDIYEQLPRTGGHSVLVTGEAGIGKTTLVNQFRDWLREQESEPILATGFCDSEVQLSYRAFKDVLQDIPSNRDISEILANAATLSAEGTRKFEQRKRVLFGEIADDIRAVATDRPVVLVVEDMQWADRGTIDLFEFLVDEVGQWSHPVLFLGTYRTSDVDQTHPVLEVVEETAAAGRGTVLELDSFDQNDVRSLLSCMLDIESLPDPFVEAVYDHTGGTPLFVHELGRHLVETLDPLKTGADLPQSLADLTVPETVEKAIEDRLDSLPDTVRPVLRLGAVIGPEFSFDLLWEASDRPVDTLIECSNTLVRREVWTQTADGIEFIHGVIREQTLARIPDGQRKTLHQQVGTAIERVYAESLEEYAGRLGYHYEQVGEYETAFEYYCQAGEHEAATYANRDAIEHYQRALSIGEKQNVSDPTTLAAIAGDVGEIYELLGEYDTAQEYYQRSRSLSVKAGDREGEAASLVDLGSIVYERGEYDRAKELFGRSLQIARQTNNPQTESDSLHGLGRVSWRQGEYAAAREYYRKSLDIRIEIGDRPGQASSHLSLGNISYRRGNYDDAQDQYERSLEIRRGLGDNDGVAELLTNIGLINVRRGSPQEARKYYQQSLEIKRETGDLRGQALVLNNLGEIAIQKGEYDQAREYYEESLRIKQEIGDRRGEVSSLNGLGQIALGRGAYNQAREYSERALATSEEIGYRRGEAVALGLLGQVATELDRYDRADELLTDSLEIARDIGELATEIDSHRKLGRLARKQDDYDQAEAFLSEAIRESDDDEQALRQAKTNLERARLALARGERQAAERAVEEAKAQFTDLQATHDRARATDLQGQIAAARDTPDEARECWESALETFDDVDAPQDALATLEALNRLSSREGKAEQAENYREQARRILTGAPESVRGEHRDWVESTTEE